MLARVFASLIVLLSSCWCQVSTSNKTSHTALSLLSQAAKRYADAKSYDIEKIEENDARSEFSRQWLKSLTKAIQETDSRYRYEVRTADGSRIRIADGKTELVYDVGSNSYLQHPVPKNGPVTSESQFPVDADEFNARALVYNLASLGIVYQAAEKLADETLTFGDQSVPCHVVKVHDKDLKEPVARPEEWFEKTIWIEKDNLTIRKVMTHSHHRTTFVPAIFEDDEITDSYPVVVLDLPIPADVFTFTPPQTAKLVEQFPSPFEGSSNDLTNKPAPDVNLTSADGHEVSLASFRGKPVLIDFWATWCFPCVVSLPQLAGIYQQVRDKGIVFLGIDKNEDAKTTADFLAKKGISWPNFHDGGDIGKAFNYNGLPLTVLVDPQGKVVFYETGYDGGLSDLRAAIAKLGPEYAALDQPAAAK